MSKRNLLEHFSTVDRTFFKQTRGDDSHQSKQSKQSNYSAEGESVASTKASDLSKSSSPRTAAPSPPKGRRRFMVLKLSKFGLFDSDDHSESDGMASPTTESKDRVPSAGYTSADCIPSLDTDTPVSSFELEMKAMSLLFDIRQRLEALRKEENDLSMAISRTMALALARGTESGALVALRKVKRSRECLQRVQVAIGYLETHEMDLMYDIEEAKRTPASEVFLWPEYENFGEEATTILSASNSDAKEEWSDSELINELEILRSTQME